MGTTKQGTKADSTRKELLELLELRKSIAEQRPRFVRPESWRYVRLHPEWRKPKGLDNKVRKSFKGYPKRVKIGYGGPAKARGYHPSGHLDVLVHNPAQLDELIPERDAVRIGRRVGAKKRAAILERATELGLRVLNPTRLRSIEPKK
ncbi:MAG TPA: 50S ribosomal protein L32e [Nitrososphaerales archaeon]|nr:50S ribosomal protein L32e [Nitrososphaerales archaeon]